MCMTRDVAAALAVTLLGVAATARAQVAVDTFQSFAAPGPRVPRSVIQASDGNFYGTSASGGPADKGTVFKMTPGGTITVLHVFTGNDGANPEAALIQG